VILAEDLAAAFLRETGCELRQRELLGRSMLIPEDDRLGSFGIIVGRLDDSVPLQFKTKTYGDDVLLVFWGGADEKKLDRALRAIVR
jgi:hypothetical protein